MFSKLAEKYGVVVGMVCLIIAAFLWGGEYVVAKDVLDIMPPNWLNVVRLAFTVLISVIVWRKHFKAATLQDWKMGAICGILFGLGSVMQTMGLEMVNAGINAFLSSAYVILVPFMVWFVSKTRPGSKVFIGAAVGIVGISIMSVTGFSTGNLSIGMGEIFSLLSAIGYGAAMVALDCYTEKSSVEFLTGAQFIFSLLVSIIFALILEEPPSVEVNSVIVVEFAYLVLLGSFVTQLLFTFGLKYSSANLGGVIFPLESVSATIFGCIFLNEKLKAVHIIGGLMIIAAIIISSVDFRKKEENLSDTVRGA